jgi:hypothetical protein
MPLVRLWCAKRPGLKSIREAPPPTSPTDPRCGADSSPGGWRDVPGLAPDYGVSHTTLSRYFARPEVGKELKRAELLQRTEQRVAEARWRAEQKAERETQRRATQQSASVSEGVRRDASAAATGHSRYVPPLQLEPCSDHWLAWYAARRLRSEHDMLNDNDARRGIVPPRERRAREHGHGRSPGNY